MFGTVNSLCETIGKLIRSDNRSTLCFSGRKAKTLPKLVVKINCKIEVNLLLANNNYNIITRYIVYSDTYCGNMFSIADMIVGYNQSERVFQAKKTTVKPNPFGEIYLFNTVKEDKALCCKRETSSDITDL